MEMPRSIVRVWAPIFVTAMMYLLVQHLAPVYWLLALPVLPIVIFMATLAEVHDEGHCICVKSLWKSNRIPKEDIVKTGESFLDGIGVLRLRRFAFPWGRIYFVREWSTLPVATRTPIFLDLLASAALMISGFAAARALSTRGFRIDASHHHLPVRLSLGVLGLLFIGIRRNHPNLANGLLFVAACLVGVIRW